jgi:hypothetical protein
MSTGIEFVSSLKKSTILLESDDNDNKKHGALSGSRSGNLLEPNASNRICARYQK